MPLAPIVSPELAGAIVLDREGRGSPLGERFGERPCLVSFLRHFGCVGCSAHVSELSPRLLELHELGVHTVFVGNGAPTFLDGFIERHALRDKHVEVVTDPSLQAFRAAGLGRNKWATLGPLSMVDRLALRGRGYSSHGVEGDVFQQAGALVVDSDRRIVFHHVAAHLAGHASPDALVAVALSLSAKRAPYRV